IMARVANWVLRDLRRRLYWHVQHLSLSYHGERRVGDLMSTVTGDVQLVLDLIEEGVLDFTINVLTLVGMTVVMFAINWRFALLVWYGAHEVLTGRLSPGSLLVFLAYLSRLYGPMRNLSKFSDVMFRASVGLERIYGVLETEREVRDLPGARAAGPFRGHIAF